MDYPNKIYVSECETESTIVGRSYFVITVAASSIDVAKNYVKNKIGIDTDPTWLMGAVYPTIYISDGSKPAELQAKILYNGNFHTY